MLLRDYILLAYPLSIITFFLITAFRKEVNKRTHGFLNAANFLILLILSLNLLYILTDAFQCWQEENSYIYNQNRDPEGGIENKHCFRIFYITLFTGFLFQLLFLWKRNRVRVWITLLSMLLVLILVFFELLIMAVMNLYRDYIPSGWVNKSGQPYWILILLAAVYFLICWIAGGFRSGNQSPKS